MLLNPHSREIECFKTLDKKFTFRVAVSCGVSGDDDDDNAGR